MADSSYLPKVSKDPFTCLSRSLCAGNHPGDSFSVFTFSVDFICLFGDWLLGSVCLHVCKVLCHSSGNFLSHHRKQFAFAHFYCRKSRLTRISKKARLHAWNFEEFRSRWHVPVQTLGSRMLCYIWKKKKKFRTATKLTISPTHYIYNNFLENTDLSSSKL